MGDVTERDGDFDVERAWTRRASRAACAD